MIATAALVKGGMKSLLPSLHVTTLSSPSEPLDAFFFSSSWLQCFPFSFLPHNNLWFRYFDAFLTPSHGCFFVFFFHRLLFLFCLHGVVVSIPFCLPHAIQLLWSLFFSLTLWILDFGFRQRDSGGANRHICSLKVLINEQKYHSSFLFLYSLPLYVKIIIYFHQPLRIAEMIVKGPPFFPLPSRWQDPRKPPLRST